MDSYGLAYFEIRRGALANEVRWGVRSGALGGYAGGTSCCLQAGGDGVPCFGDGCTGIKDFESDVYEYSGLSGPATSVKHLHTAEEGMVAEQRVCLGMEKAV